MPIYMPLLPLFCRPNNDHLKPRNEEDDDDNGSGNGSNNYDLMYM